MPNAINYSDRRKFECRPEKLAKRERSASDGLRREIAARIGQTKILRLAYIRREILINRQIRRDIYDLPKDPPAR